MAFKSEEELNKAFEAVKANLAIEGRIITKRNGKNQQIEGDRKIAHEQLITLADAIARCELT